MLTSEVVSWCHPQLVTVVSIILNACTDGRRVPAIALKCAVDGSDRGPEPLARGYDRMDIVHPVPEGCLERDHSICGHSFWSIQAVESDAVSGRPIVEVS